MAELIRKLGDDYLNLEYYSDETWKSENYYTRWSTTLGMHVTGLPKILISTIWSECDRVYEDFYDIYILILSPDHDCYHMFHIDIDRKVRFFTDIEYQYWPKLEEYLENNPFTGSGWIDIDFLFKLANVLAKAVEVYCGLESLVLNELQS